MDDKKLKKDPWRVAVGHRLRAIREARHLTQADLAKATNRSQSLIAQVEAGDKALPADAVQSLASNLGIDEGELLRGVESPAKSLDLLVSGWSAYDVAVLRLDDTIQLLRRITRWMDASQPVLEGSTTVESRKELREWIEFCRRMAKWDPQSPHVEDARSKLQMVGTLPSVQALRTFAELFDAIAKLSETDRSLVQLLVNRLADQPSHS